jgi:hypothetical protein
MVDGREIITLHRLIKSEQLEEVSGLHIRSSVKDTNSELHLKDSEG